MTKNCILPFCKHRGKVAGIKYHRISPHKRESWLKAIGRNPCDKIGYYSFICSAHFRKQDFDKDGILLENAIPTLNIRPTTNVQKSAEKCVEVPSEINVMSRQVLTELNISPRENKTVRVELIAPISSDDISVSSKMPDYKRLNSDSVSSRPDTSGMSTIPETQIKKRTINEEHASSSDSAGLTIAVKKQRKIILQDHNYSTLPATQIKEVTCPKRQKQQIVRCENQRSARLQKKIIHLKNVIQTMKENEKKNDVLHNSIDVLEKTLSGIPLAIMKRMLTNMQSEIITRTPFPEELKTFALTLYFYSPQAYDYVRDVFSSALPSPNVLRNWITK